MNRTAIAGIALVAVLLLALSLGANRNAARADVDSTAAISCLFVAEVIDGDPLDVVTGNEVFAACDSLTPSEIATIASGVGDQDAALEAGELGTIDVDANQVTDDLAATLPRLTTIYVFAFVDDDGRVTFDADSGVSVSINDDGSVTDPTPADDANVETCEGDDDADCGTSILGDGDGVVVATITETSANEGDAIDVDVTQEGVTQTQTIHVVGAADEISLIALKPTIESGALPVCTDGGLEYVLFNMDDPRSTAVDAEVTDSDGRSLSRISVSFNSGNTAVATIGYTSYLTRADSSGSSALAIVCGVDPGSTFIEADIGVEQQAVQITVQEPCDPGPCPTATATPVIGCDPTSPPCPTATSTPDPNAPSPPLCEWPLSPPNCGPDADSDGVPDDAEFWYGTNPNDPDTDDDGFLDRPQLVHLGENTDQLRDNCPSVHNAPQFNTDGNFINYFSAKVFNDVTAPMSDAAGNACDTDDDNDSSADADEANGFDCGAAANTVTDPLDADSDEDLVLDGAECILGTDPNNINSVPPVASCVASGDNDSDRMLDSREFCFYGTSASFTDSDNDGCTDGAEIASVNGDTKVDALDLAQIAQNFNAIAYTVPAPPHIVQFDVNRDRKITSIDLSLIAQQFNALRCM
jgi:hypothetical protein